MSRVQRADLGAELIPGVLIFGAFVYWAGFAESGFDPTDWYPGALWLLGVLALVAVVFARGRAALGLPGKLAIGLLAAYAVWSLASITWSDAKGDAWEGANEALMYASVFASFALLRWRPGSAALLLGAYSVAIAVVALFSLLNAADAAVPNESFIAARLTGPGGYHNATAALYVGAFFPALVLATRRETPWMLRGLLAVSGALLLQVSLLSQSRGSLLALPLTVIVYLILTPNRARALVVALIVVGAAALAAPALLDVYPAARDDIGLHDALVDARSSVVISCLILLVVGTALAFADSRIQTRESTARGLSIAVFGAAAVAVIAGVVIALVAIGSPGPWVSDRWDDFKNTGETEVGDSHLTSGLGSNRYDFYRVALESWQDRPLAGIGVRQFAATYLAERRSDEEPEYTHSLTMQLLAETGIIGALLFAGFLFAAVLAAVQARRRASTGFAGAMIAGAFAVGAYWLIHGQVDWLWAFPALSGPAFACLGLAGRVIDDSADRPEADDEAEYDEDDADEHEDDYERRGSRDRRPLVVASWIAAGLIALVVAVSYLLPWGASRDIATASATWGANPDAAFDRLDRAADLDFLSEEPYVTEGAIAVRRHDVGRARTAYAEAVDRNPSNWYAQFELGAIEAVRGDRAAATARLRKAEALNPREPLVRLAVRGVRDGEPLPLARIDRILLQRVCALVGRTSDTRFCRS